MWEDDFYYTPPSWKYFLKEVEALKNWSRLFYPLDCKFVRWVLQVILTCLSTASNKIVPIFLWCRPSVVYTEFSNLAKGKTFMLALLRHKAGLTHTLDGRQHTRDERTRILPHKYGISSSFCLTCMRHKKVRNYDVRLLPQAESYSPKLKVSESQDEICFSTSIPMRLVSTYDVMEQASSSQ